MGTVRYFAYGSNMLTERFCARVQSARAIGVATLADHQLDFAKVSIDGSGKADVVQAPGSNSYGVLFEVEDSELGTLDDFEGPDYQRVLSQVRFNDAIVDATCYVAKADKRRSKLTPYCWYLALVRAGALQHALPADHLEALRHTRFSVDPVPNRKTRLAALAALEASGYLHLLEDLSGKLTVGNGRD